MSTLKRVVKQPAEKNRVNPHQSFFSRKEAESTRVSMVIVKMTRMLPLPEIEPYRPSHNPSLY
jgi:hypothetical protein